MLPAFHHALSRASERPSRGLHFPSNLAVATREPPLRRCIEAIRMRLLASPLPRPSSPLRRRPRNWSAKGRPEFEGTHDKHRGDRSGKHTPIFSAVGLAVKLWADKPGGFVLPLSRES